MKINKAINEEEALRVFFGAGYVANISTKKSLLDVGVAVVERFGKKEIPFWTKEIEVDGERFTLERITSDPIFVCVARRAFELGPGEVPVPKTVSEAEQELHKGGEWPVPTVRPVPLEQEIELL